MRPNVDLFDIRVFVTLAEELNFRRTAERVGLTPSRVSQKIRTLEMQAGVPLFERTTRRVALTPAGKELQNQWNPAYEQIVDAFAHVQELGAEISGVFRLSIPSQAAAGRHLTEIVKTFEARYPGCRAEMISATAINYAHLEALQHGDVDLTVLHLPLSDPDFAIGPILVSEERVLIVAKDHPLGAKDSVSYEDVGPYVVPVNSTFPAEALDAQYPPRTASGRQVRRRELRDVSELVGHIARGEVVFPAIPSFLEYYGHPNITAVPLRDLPPLQSALVWFREHDSLAIQAFVHTAAEILDAKAQRP